MAITDIQQSVYEIVSQKTNYTLSKIDNDLKIETLGADSLSTIEITMALEEKFNIRIEDKEISDVQTVGDVVKIVEHKLKS